MDCTPVGGKPRPEGKIWRYMDFAKFVSMLAHGGLFFPRADLLGDPFEGSFSRANERLRPSMYPDIKDLDKHFATLGSFLKWSRGWTMVCCWHMNDTESAAMWKLYAQKGYGIAIQTTYRLLRQALPDDVKVAVKI